MPAIRGTVIVLALLTRLSSAGEQSPRPAPENVVLSASRCLEAPGDSGGAVWELRLYETTGRGAEATIRLRDPVREVQITNLLGRAESHLAPPRISGREVHAQIRPWKIVTLRAVTGSR